MNSSSSNRSSARGPADNRIRPGVWVVMACVLTATLVTVGIYWKSSSKTSPPPADDNAAPEPAAVEPAAPVATTKPVPAATFPPSTLEEQGGLQVTSVALSASGAALDLRYKVTAPEKLAALTETNNPTFLIDQASGTRIPVGVPPVSSKLPAESRARSAAMMMRQSSGFPPAVLRSRAPGQIYSVLIPNQGGLLTQGSKVTLVVGSLQATDLVVQ